MANSIPALVPRGRGHQFVVYGDSCSGVPGGPHERTFACVNAVVRRLQPQPEFILFLGDEIVGLTADARALRAQWSHWLDVEMAWLDRGMTPVWHTTSNHTTYDVMSEAVFREVLRLPENGPPQQVRLSYFVRRNDLLLVFVHTSWSGLGGEGHVETEWLETKAPGTSSCWAIIRYFPSTGFLAHISASWGPNTLGHSGIFWLMLGCWPIYAAIFSPLTYRHTEASCRFAQLAPEPPIECRKKLSTCIAFKLRSMRKDCGVRFSTPLAS